MKLNRNIAIQTITCCMHPICITKVMLQDKSQGPPPRATSQVWRAKGDGHQHGAAVTCRAPAQKSGGEGYYILYTIYYMQYTVYCILYIIYFMLYAICYILCDIHCTLHTIHYTLDVIYYMLYTIHSTPAKSPEGRVRGDRCREGGLHSALGGVWRYQNHRGIFRAPLLGAPPL